MEISKQLVDVLCDGYIYLIGEWDKGFEVDNIDDIAELLELCEDDLLYYLIEHGHIYLDYNRWDTELKINYNLHLTKRDYIRLTPKLKEQYENANEILKNCTWIDKS